MKKALQVIAWTSALLIAVTALPASAKALSPFIAHYDVSAGWVPLGQARFQLEPAGGNDCYLYKYVAHATGLVGIVRDDVITEKSHFCVTNGKIRPHEDTFHHKGGDGHDNFTLKFNWQKMTVTNEHDGKTRSLPDDGLDRQVIQLWLRRKLERAGPNLPAAPFKVTLVNDDDNTTYTLKIMGTESVSVPLGDFKTVRVDRIGSKKRVAKFWLSPALDYLPVKVEQKDNDHMAVVLELKALPQSPSGQKALQAALNGEGIGVNVGKATN